MFRNILITLTLAASIVILQVSRAQSVINLPTLDLTPSLGSESPGTIPNDLTGESPLGCTSDSGEDCVGTRSAVPFTMNDVVNLGIIDREEVTQNPKTMATQALPSIDLEVLFDFASDSLRNDQLPQLARVAEQLRGVELSQGYLVVIGHTDAVGSAEYNEQLSLRRAQNVATYLQNISGIPPGRIRTSGAGFRFLKYPSDPTHSGNRRVQLLLTSE